ncbi:MAG: universal stress protein [Alcaligenaceae bacterium]|nr:MAG: universal stress protein [Alcaligenaceae bacterium]
MPHVLIPMDGSTSALQAVEFVIQHRAMFEPLQVSLLNVQPGLLPEFARLLIGGATVDDYHIARGEVAFHSACVRLNLAHIPYGQEINIGHVAESIVEYAADHRCDHIVMGSRGLGSTGQWLLGSSTTQVLHLAEVPVTVVKAQRHH